MTHVTSKALWNMILDHKPDNSIRLDRIENRVGDGTPDVNYCYKGVEGWIELKTGSNRRDPKVAVFHKKYGMTVEQKGWHVRQRQARGRSYILLRISKTIFLIHGSYADRINSATTLDLHNLSMIDTPVPVPADWWPQLWHRLTA